MPESVNDIESLIRESRDRLSALNSFADMCLQVEAGTFDYKALIPKSLANTIDAREDTRVQQVSRIVTTAAQKMQSAIGWPIRANIYLPRGGPSAESEQDKGEAFYAHWLRRTDPNQTVKRRVEFGMVHWPFAPVWLSVNPYKPPEDEKRRERYDRGYWRWSMNVLSWKTTGFLDRDGIVTFGAIEEEIPVISLVQEYGDKEKALKGGYANDPLRWWSEQFPQLRAADGSSPDRGSDTERMNATVTRCLVNDGRRTYHYVKQAGTNAKQRYEEIVESYPNTFGCVPLFVFSFYERPFADMGIRYEPGIGPLAATVKDAVLQRGMMMTVAGNRRWGEIEDPEVAKQRIAMSVAGIKNADPEDLRFATKEGTTIVPALKGQMQDVSNTLPDEFWKAYDANIEDRNYILQSLELLSPSPDMVEKATLGAILYGAEASQRDFNAPNASIVNNWRRIFLAVAHDMVYGWDDGADKKFEWTMIGDEFTKKGYKGGESMSISPSYFEQFPDAATINVEQVAETAAQRAAAERQEMDKIPMGLSNPAKVAEAGGIQDVGAWLAEQEGWELYQGNAQQLVNASKLQTLQFIAQAMEIPVEQVMMLTGSPNVQMEGGGQQESSTSGFTYNTPATSPPGAGA